VAEAVSGAAEFAVDSENRGEYDEGASVFAPLALIFDHLCQK
jgi:hypothetical protein